MWLCMVPVALAPPRPPNAFERLLNMVGTGADVSQAVELANEISHGRYTKQIMDSLAEVVAKTKHKWNYERSLHRWFRKQAFAELMPQPYNFPLTVYGTTKLSMKRAVHACLLPHEWFGTLYAFPELFEELMTGGEANLRHFWDRSRETDWYRSHPVIGTAKPEWQVPIGHHGDDVGVFSGEKVLVMTWGSVATALNVLDTRLIFTGIYVKQLIDDVTLDEIHKVFAWSMRCLALGIYPANDHNGRPFSLGHHPHRFALANRENPLIAGGHIGVWSEMRGDWKYVAQALTLAASFATAAKLCHLCKANRTKRRLWYTHTRRNYWPLRRTRYSHRNFVRSQRAAPGNTTGPLYDIPGFHIWRVWVDPMHSMDLGILQKLTPSTLLELTARRGEPYAAATGEYRRLQAYREYRAWCKANHTEPCAPFDSSKWFKNPWPEMTMKSAKAAHQRSMQYWLFEKCSQELNLRPSVHNAIRCELWGRLVRFDVICRLRLADRTLPCAGRFFSAEEAEALKEHMEMALDCYKWLANEAIGDGSNLWKLQPQMHMLTHLAYDMAPQANPRRVHCYGDEDMVGRFKKLVAGCHPLTAGTKSVMRYSIMLAFRGWVRLAEVRNLLDDL